MDFRKIEYFIKVAEYLNFSSAADEIHISHQGLSKQIRLLEEELGAVLFERSTSYVSLTEVGKKMYELFKPIVNNANHSYEEIKNFIQYKKSMLKVGYFNALSFRQVVDPLLKYIRKKNPAIEMDVFATDIGAARNSFMNDELDLLITVMIKEEEWADVSYYSLATIPLKIIVAAGHPWYDRDTVTETDMAQASLLFYEEGSPAFMENMPVRERISMRNFDSYIGRLSAGEEFGVVADIYSRREGDFRLLNLPEKYAFNAQIIAAFKKENPQKELLHEIGKFHL